MNARFWIYVNGGPVKITLRPGQSITHESGGPCDEGWSYESETWTLETDRNNTPIVARAWCTESQDCDGRHGNSGNDHCERLRLKSGGDPYYTELESHDDPTTWDGVIWPDWQEVSRGPVYDQYAQAAGY